MEMGGKRRKTTRETNQTSTPHSQASNAGPNYEHEHFHTAEALLEKVELIPTLETKTTDPEFIFRGERNANWKLIPSALRSTPAGPPGQTRAMKVAGTRGVDADEQLFAEFILLREFVDSCDRAVAPLAGDDHQFRQEFLTVGNEAFDAFIRDTSKWPHQRHLPMLAAAQHYGVPTRLLDWTRSALVAAYFAAAGAASFAEERGAYEAENLQVWAFNIEYAHFYKIELVAMPGANNLRLGRQRGLFTLIRERAGRGSPVTQTEFQDALVSENEDKTKPKPLWKLTLPSEQAERLLYLCHLRGVDATTVLPGIEGAATATMERGLWQRTDPTTGTNIPDLFTAERRGTNS